jgi:hypothetical protein
MVSCCVFFEVAMKVVEDGFVVGVVRGFDSWRLTAVAEDECVVDATAIVAKEATNADRDKQVAVVVAS